ncbi:putative tRNA (cytidine(32)/guanosine(34)-2'-O)-methyltransferase [Camellia sinensis]|uniref:putative tRNA (cytidine(32)/guanosine(34)-2'-O)-methyltransferase n=1 Tax=Camellia sinensis TaxID=4442 RepID=UPI0010367CCA|nr:putative tRNA (cytidine(32)/guanosine(34)-2'-O)-methyltransferase [Camellia sinensis]
MIELKVKLPGRRGISRDHRSPQVSILDSSLLLIHYQLHLVSSPSSLLTTAFYFVLHSEDMFGDCSNGWLKGLTKVYIPFLASGDVSGYDLDRSYPLPRLAEETYQSLDPIQPPIGPPYTSS